MVRGIGMVRELGGGEGDRDGEGDRGSHQPSRSLQGHATLYQAV